MMISCGDIFWFFFVVGQGYYLKLGHMLECGMLRRGFIERREMMLSSLALELSGLYSSFFTDLLVTGWINSGCYYKRTSFSIGRTFSPMQVGVKSVIPSILPPSSA